MFSAIWTSILLYISLSGESAFASSGGGIPWSGLIIPQIVNFSIFAVSLYVLLKKPIKDFFAGRKVAFEAAANEAARAKSEAQTLHDQIKARINEIESQSKRDLEQAKKDAAATGSQIISDAKAAAQRIEGEAKSSIQQELLRTVSALKSEFISHSFNEAETKIKSSADEKADKLLQQEFLVKAKQVRA